MPSIITRHEAKTIRACAALVRTALDGVTMNQAVFRCEAGGNHMLWNAGHIAWSLSVDLGETIGVPPQLPPVYNRLFAFGSDTLADAKEYPSIEEILDVIEETAERVASFLESLDDMFLESPLARDSPLSDYYPTVGELVASNGFHTGYHLGQIGLLRRIQGLSPALS